MIVAGEKQRKEGKKKEKKLVTMTGKNIFAEGQRNLIK